MSDVMTQVPPDSPLMKAWEIYRVSEEYKNSFKWAKHEKHRDGSMWDAFNAGYEAGQEGKQKELEGGE